MTQKRKFKLLFPSMNSNKIIAKFFIAWSWQVFMNIQNIYDVTNSLTFRKIRLGPANYDVKASMSSFKPFPLQKKTSKAIVRNLKYELNLI